MVLGKHRTQAKEELLDNPSLYRSLVGGLQYLVNTRPDVAFVVNQLSQHLNSPSILDWMKAKRILRYLRGTVDLILHIKHSLELTLVVFHMRIGLMMCWIEGLLLFFVFFWVIHSFLGQAKCKVWFQGLVLKLNIVLWLL